MLEYDEARDKLAEAAKSGNVMTFIELCNLVESFDRKKILEEAGWVFVGEIWSSGGGLEEECRELAFRGLERAVENELHEEFFEICRIWNSTPDLNWPPSWCEDSDSNEIGDILSFADSRFLCELFACDDKEDPLLEEGTFFGDLCLAQSWEAMRRAIDGDDPDIFAHILFCVPLSEETKQDFIDEVDIDFAEEMYECYIDEKGYLRGILLGKIESELSSCAEDGDSEGFANVLKSYGRHIEEFDGGLLSASSAGFLVEMLEQQELHREIDGLLDGLRANLLRIAREAMKGGDAETLSKALSNDSFGSSFLLLDDVDFSESVWKSVDLSECGSETATELWLEGVGRGGSAEGILSLLLDSYDIEVIDENDERIASELLPCVCDRSVLGTLAEATRSETLLNAIEKRFSAIEREELLSEEIPVSGFKDAVEALYRVVFEGSVLKESKASLNVRDFLRRTMEDERVVDSVFETLIKDAETRRESELRTVSSPNEGES